MAAGSLLALLDDVTAVLDDVAAMTKLATKKTAGVLGDDLAVNAEKVSGIAAARELKVVWAVAKGSFINKLFLVPGALALNYVAPWSVPIILALGGAYLCYEGFEKVLHWIENAKHKKQEQQVGSVVQSIAQMSDEDWVAHEKAKIKAAVRTDLVLSAEIIAITLGVVAAASFTKQFIVLSSMAIAMTIFVYGLVALIVKIDDIGFWLEKKKSSVAQFMGQKLIASTPWMMATLSVVGTVAMFMVGGGILAHLIPGAHFNSVGQLFFEMAVGVVSGALVWAGVVSFFKIKGKFKAK